MPNAVELHDVLCRARKWIAQASQSTDLRGSLQSLFGIWVCDRALNDPTPSPELRGAVQSVLARLERALKEETFDPYSYDPKLILLCGHILELNQHEVPPIRAFVDTIADALRQLPAVPSRLAGVAAILHELGHRDIDVSVKTDPPTVDGVHALLTGGEKVVRAECSLVAAASHFGARPVPGRLDLFSGLRDLLPVILLQSMRMYDLDTGAMLLRSAHYLRMAASQQFEDAFIFLIDQQKPTGAFGFFAVEVDAIRQARDTSDFHEIGSVYLPVTITSVWAIAQIVHKGCLLFDDRPGQGQRSESLRSAAMSPTP